MYALMNFHALSNRNEHIEPKSSMKGVAADQIKRARQNYWGAQAPPHATALLTKPGRRRQREGQESNRLNEQNNNSARASHFFVHFFAFTEQPRREMTKF